MRSGSSGGSSVNIIKAKTPISSRSLFEAKNPDKNRFVQRTHQAGGAS
jgi:hypothetical protein